MIKTSPSTGALLSVDGQSLISVLGVSNYGAGYSGFALFISFVLFWLWRQRERTIVLPSLACLLK